MVWITVNFSSSILHMPVEVEILLPQPEQVRKSDLIRSDQNKKNKVLILLHGVGHDRTEWLMKSQIYDMAEGRSVLVCMPSGKNSLFLNTANGYHYMDYVTKELPDLLKRMFYVSDKKEDWMIAGASAGGYSALLCGLHPPEQFGYLASFSGTLCLKKKEICLSEKEMGLIFGSDKERKENLFYLCNQVTKIDRPHIMLVCGKQDSLYEENLCFYEGIKGDYQVVWIDGDGGHNFIYWNEHLKELLEWFFREGN